MKTTISTGSIPPLFVTEQQDWQLLLAWRTQQKADTGCTAPTIAYYYTAAADAERLSLYLSHFRLKAEASVLSEADSWVPWSGATGSKVPEPAICWIWR